jgi:NAD(P)-dependent dehydrogenase (short-subunit alcohol dehydrogenase family)
MNWEGRGRYRQRLRHVAIVTNVSDLNAPDALYAEVSQRFGRIRVLYADAGGQQSCSIRR